MKIYSSFFLIDFPNPLTKPGKKTTFFKRHINIVIVNSLNKSFHQAKPFRSIKCQCQRAYCMQTVSSRPSCVQFIKTCRWATKLEKNCKTLFFPRITNNFYLFGRTCEIIFRTDGKYKLTKMVNFAIARSSMAFLRLSNQIAWSLASYFLQQTA